MIPCRGLARGGNRADEPRQPPKGECGGARTGRGAAEQGGLRPHPPQWRRIRGAAGTAAPDAAVGGRAPLAAPVAVGTFLTYYPPAVADRGVQIIQSAKGEALFLYLIT